MIRTGIAVTTLVLTLLGAASAQALTLQQVGGDFDNPVYVTSDPGDSGRLFVVERKGAIKQVRNGVTTVFADLSAEVGCAPAGCKGERGLMSVAPAPDFGQSGRLYVDYANDADGAIHIAEITAGGPGHDSADPSSLRSLLTIPHPESEWHNGGQIQFGPDGNLYISTGDGGGNDGEFHHAQDPGSQLGKILRIRPDPGGPSPHYTLPAGNPFASTVWNLGLRNPYRFSFDRLSGDMIVADVGQGLGEEIDFAPSPAPGVVSGAGANYGWNCREGFGAGPGTDPQCAGLSPESFTAPVFEYATHSPDPDSGTPRCSVIGGYVVRDAALGALAGNYVYADYCSGVVRALRLPAQAGGRASGDCSLGLSLSQPVSFGEDADGRIYLVEEGGKVYRVAGQPPTTCPPGQQQAEAPGKKTFVGIKAQRRRVERGKRALLTVWVSPCAGRKAKRVTLLRNGRPNGTRALSRACTVRFAPRVRRGTAFAATTRPDRAGNYLAGKSRKLKVRLAHHRRQR